MLLGFRSGATSTHTSRTMMLAELSALLDRLPAAARAAEYMNAVVEHNALAKPTQATRKTTAKRLAELYALDPACPLFRLMRHFWAADAAARPFLAFLLAVARDPLLREATHFVIGTPLGAAVTPAAVADSLAALFPERFGPSTALATAQRLASTWGQAGYLAGKVRKRRVRLPVSPAATAYAVLLGYLCGWRGRTLLDTVWTRLLDRTPAEVTDLTAEASRHGHLTYKAAGAVVEITFPGLLTPAEERVAHDAA